MFALLLAATLSTLVLVFWAGAFAGYVLGYAHRGLVGCRPWGRLWRWWARVTWRLLIGRQDPHAGRYVDRDRISVCGPEYPSFRVR